ncbi:MAG: DoxX family protein [Thermomicrobiales bacterium]|nr:DoxX family protein [Thermomicrobiales bacterium]MDF3040095.1 DoxX family protein [Thermomicrobiales bacterium]
MKYALWVVQVLLALAFVSAGAIKLISPDEVLTAWYPFPAAFIRFIGVCELLGAVGLILPGLLRIRQGLTPLAAAGLAIIMAGAVATTLAIGGGMAALMPLALGLLAVFVAVGRARMRRQSANDDSHLAALQTAG